MKGLFVLGMLLLVVGCSFALPEISWAINTAGNNTTYYGDEFMFNMTSNESMNLTGNAIQIDGVNYTCDLSADRLSCNTTLGYLDKIYNHTYSAIGFANISNVSYNNPTRVINYYGCGFVNDDETLLYDIGSENYTQTCLTINASNITLDGNAKSVTVDNTTSGISSTTKNNITITEVEVVGGAYGISLLDTNNSVIDNVQVFGVAGSNNGISLGDSSNNNISNSYVEGYGYGIYMSSASNYNNVSSNEVTGNAVGLYAGDTGNILDSNTVYLNTGDGIILSSPINASIDRNEIYSNPIGIMISNSNLTTLWLNHYYNNTNVDYYISNTNNVTYLNFIIYDTFDNPLGNYVNHTTIFSMDYVEYNDSYIISGASFVAVPSNMSVFRGKAIALDDGVLSSDAIIDEIVFVWNNTEAVGYDESLFGLWKEPIAGTFVLLNDTPNVSSNWILTYNVNVSGLAVYGIMYPSTTQQTLNDYSTTVNQVVSLLVALLIISSLIGGVLIKYGVADMQTVMTFVMAIFGISAIVCIVYSVLL